MEGSPQTQVNGGSSDARNSKTVFEPATPQAKLEMDDDAEGAWASRGQIVRNTGSGHRDRVDRNSVDRYNLGA